MRYISLLIVAVFVFSSCEDFFNQVVEVDVGEVNPRIVLDARVAAGDSSMTIFVSSSRGILDDSPYSYEAIIQDSMYYLDFNGDSVLYINTYFQKYDTIPDITLELFKNGVSLGQILPQLPGYYLLNHPFSEFDNDEYKIVAIAPGFESAETKATIPDKPVIKSIDFTLGQGGGGGPFGDQNNALDIVIDDISEAPDYYLVEVYSRYDTFQPFQPEYVNSDDPFASGNEYGGIIISDESFNGGQYNLRLSTYNDLVQYESKVVLKAISKDYYLFSLSVGLYRNANGNPFAEPVLLHSNVVNGYGLFSIVNGVEKKVE